MSKLPLKFVEMGLKRHSFQAGHLCKAANCLSNRKLALFKEYLSMTDSYGCFSTYHVALADALSYRQLFMYIHRYS